MSHNIPRAVVRWALLLAVLSFMVSMYLEQEKVDWLDAHPISVNLISGFIAFNLGILFLAVVFRWFVREERVKAIQAEFTQQLAAVSTPFQESYSKFTSLIHSEAHRTQGKSAGENESYPRMAEDRNSVSWHPWRGDLEPWMRVTAELVYAATAHVQELRTLADVHKLASGWRSDIADQNWKRELGELEAAVGHLPDAASEFEVGDFMRLGRKLRETREAMIWANEPKAREIATLELKNHR